MCGIPMMPETVPDAVRGKKLTFEQALLHIGGFDNLVSVGVQSHTEINIL